jgi:hypothetical protein
MDDDHGDEVSELWSPTGLLFITKVIYEYGEPRWQNANREKILIRPPELSGNPISKVIW